MFSGRFSRFALHFQAARGVKSATKESVMPPLFRSSSQVQSPNQPLATKMISFLLFSLLLLASVRAFVTKQHSRASLFELTKHDVTRLPVDWTQESDMPSQGRSRSIKPTTPWVEKSNLHKAIECAEDECDANELTFHISSLMQLDDECLFHQAFDDEPPEECSNMSDLHLVQRILQLQSKVRSLRQELKQNEFAKAIKKQHDEVLQNHWYKDYLEFYQM